MRRHVIRALALLIVVAFMLGTAPSARGAVAFRQATSATSSTSTASNSLSLTIPRPSGLAVDDVMIASVQWVLRTANGSTVGATPPAGWTEVDNNNQTGWAVEVWWKRATAADVAAASFTFSASWFNRQGIASGVISAYSGVTRSGSPLAWGQVQRTGFNSSNVGNGQYGIARPGDTAFSAPTYTPTRGSMSVSIVMADRSGNANQLDLSSVSDGTLAASQPATGGGGTDGINTAVAHRPADAGGGYPDPHTQMSFANTIQWTAFSMVLRPTPCGGGGRSLSAAPVSFPAVTLDGFDRNVATTIPIGVDDQTEDGATSAGWSLTLSATQFTNGGRTLPADALSVTSASSADAGGRCAAPTSAVTYGPLAVPAGSTTKLYNAAANTGRGPSTVSLAMRLAIPGNARAGTYVSTWTYTLSAGP